MPPMPKAAVSAVAAAAAVLLVAGSTAMAWAEEVRQTPVAAEHPLLGRWQVEGPGGCVDEITLRADGRKAARSGEATSDAVFELSAEPLPSGFYRLTERLTAVNGKPDCRGRVAPDGEVATTWLRLHPGFDRFVLCLAPNMKSCLAEFRRQGDGG